MRINPQIWHPCLYAFKFYEKLALADIDFDLTQNNEILQEPKIRNFRYFFPFPMSLPPKSCLDDAIKKEAERVFRHLAVDFATRNIPEFDISQSYGFQCPPLAPLSLAFAVASDHDQSVCGPGAFPTNLQPIFSAETGQIVAYEERWTNMDDQQQSQHSMSIRRAPDPRAFSHLLGNSANVPFLPAGFDDVELEELLRFSNTAGTNSAPGVAGELPEKDGDAETAKAEEERFLNFEDILATPPGFAGPVNLNGFQLDVERIFHAERAEDESSDDGAEAVAHTAGGADIGTEIGTAQQQQLLDVDAMLDEAAAAQIGVVEDDANNGTTAASAAATVRHQKLAVIASAEHQNRRHPGLTDAAGVNNDEEEITTDADDAAVLRTLDETVQKLGEASVAGEASAAPDQKPSGAAASAETAPKPSVAHIPAKTGPESKFAFAQMLDVNRKVPEFDALRDNMAKQYPFELDPFQQQAIVRMEQGASVFVAAHTSAGKTVVAEYAVALCKLHRTRVIYTSPIKALSNQKFRDFRLHFGDVGLVTGDIQLHSDAFCLVMTTEILRSMLYNGSEVIRELEWCIFDEVHYINDAERGHVWEEVLIMLPAHVKIVMLSATVPNCMEFADWVGRIKNRKIFVIQTLKRPVPLEHYLYTGQDGKTKKDMFMILDKRGDFLTSGYQKAVEAKARKMEKLAEKAATAAGRGGGGRGGAGGRGGGAAARGGGGGRGGGGRRGGGAGAAPPAAHRWPVGPMGGTSGGANTKNSKNVFINLIDHLKTEDLLPMVVFVFSRQRCDDTAQLLQSVDMTTEKEKSAIHRFFTKCIDRLKGTDKMLPQVLLMQELCKRGFAVHHSGILPIVKEVVELLFQRGYVKILFATETFAMGVNMPARTVAFETIEKFDGNQKRFLNPTEYVQMAGRAGRRGLDSTGTVIILAKGPEPPDIASLKSMLNGKPIALESRFRLTYGMLLNLLRVEQLRIEDMLQRSYVERASLRAVVTRKAKLKEIDDQIDALPAMECAHCAAAAAPSPPHPSADGTASATATNCCPTMPPANNDDSVPSTSSSSSSMASVRLYFETVLGYADALATTWPLVVQRGREDKLFAPGRVVVVHYAPLSIVGRLAVVLKARFTDTGGHFLLTLFVPNSGDKFSEFGQRHKAYDALSEEDKKWHRNGLLLSHAALHGPEGVVPAHAFAREAPFTILEDVGLDSLTAVCRRSIAKLSVDTVLEEHRRISGPYRAQSPDRAVRRLLVELETLSDRFEQQQQQLKRRDMSELVYVLGQDTDRRDVDMVDRLREVRELRAQLVVEPEALFPCLKCPQIGQHLRMMAQRCKLEEQKRRLAFETSSNNLQFSKEYVDRLKVLQALHYIDRHNMVGLKGKVACEISNQELLITELILDNKFEQRTAAQIAAMLSSITCQFEAKNQNNAHGSGGGGGGGRFQRDNAPTAVAAAALADHQQQQQQNERLPERMDRVLLKELEHDVIAAANRIDAVQRQYGVANSPVVDELKFGLMEVVHQWATGMEFADIMRLTDAQEGIIVRCIQRLDEVCKDVRKAARIVGDPALFEKMGETSAAIRRDIVFAASLYTTEEE